MRFRPNFYGNILFLSQNVKADDNRVTTKLLILTTYDNQMTTKCLIWIIMTVFASSRAHTRVTYCASHALQNANYILAYARVINKKNTQYQPYQALSCHKVVKINNLVVIWLYIGCH